MVAVNDDGWSLVTSYWECAVKISPPIPGWIWYRGYSVCCISFVFIFQMQKETYMYVYIGKILKIVAAIWDIFMLAHGKNIFCRQLNWKYLTNHQTNSKYFRINKRCGLSSDWFFKKSPFRHHKFVPILVSDILWKIRSIHLNYSVNNTRRQQKLH